MGLLIMKHYISIIRKADFTDLFKYGHFNVRHAVRFDGNVEEHASDDLLFEQLTLGINAFEYSFEYLIIHFVSEQENCIYFSVNIENIKGIYAFDDEAKKEMSISFDPRIQINVSPWTDKFNKLYQSILMAQSMRGVNNIWTIFDLPEEELTKCKEFIPDEIINDVFRQFYSGEQASGELPIWNYLLRYERHSLYPKDMRGFFCDFVHVVCNWKSKKTITEDAAERTEIYQQIVNAADDKFKTLVEVAKSSPLADMTKEEAKCEFVIVAPLFLYLKDKYIEGIEHRPDQNFSDYVKKFEIEGRLALYLLGLTLGYDKTYDAFYESANLSFLKKRIEPPKIEDPTEENMGDQTEPVNTPPGELFPDENPSPSKPQVFAWYRKAKGNADIRPVFSQEEAESLQKEGYKPVEKFIKAVCEAIRSWGYDPEKEKQRFLKTKEQ